MASWLPKEIEAQPLDELDWWRPKLVAEWLGEDAAWGSLSYIVVDDLDKEAAGLVVTPWPRVDELGRLHFGDEDDAYHVAVDVSEFGALLRERREPIVRFELDEEKREELLNRRLAIGDVFVARLAKRFRRTPVDPAKWMHGEVLDITGIARAVAKGQTAAALAGVLYDADVETVGSEMSEDEG